MFHNRKRQRAHHFVHTRRVDEFGEWYALDNAAIIMPAMIDSVTTGLFRFEAELDSPIDLDAMHRALSATVLRMPYFNVTLRRGFFWYYFEPAKTEIPLYPDDPSPCQEWNINRPGTRLFRIRCGGNMVAGEFSHAMTDGAGGMTFFKTLLAHYFLAKGIEPEAELGKEPWSDILLSTRDVAYQDTPIIPAEEFEDAYQRYFPKGLPYPDTGPRAFHLKSAALPSGHYRVIDGTLVTSEALALAKNRHVSLTELMIAVYLDALQHIWHSTQSHRRDHFVVVEVPINLRALFPSRSYRNFSLFVLVGEDMRLGMRSFDELVDRTHYQMKLEYDRMSVAKHLSRNAGSARSLAVRIVPLAIKDIFARILFAKYGETMLSGFISNIGALKMPPGFVPHINSFRFIPAPSMTTMTNASMVSWGDHLSVSFGSLAQSRELEQLFFTRLRSLGLQVKVRCRLDEAGVHQGKEEGIHGVLS